MKTVSSLAQATKLAARSGATLEVNGRRINSAGTKLSVVPANPAPLADGQASVVATPAAAADAPLDQLALLIARQGEAMRSAVESLAARPADPPVRVLRARPKAFEIERNADGTPVRLIPIYE